MKLKKILLLTALSISVVSLPVVAMEDSEKSKNQHLVLQSVDNKLVSKTLGSTHIDFNEDIQGAIKLQTGFNLLLGGLMPLEDNSIHSLAEQMQNAGNGCIEIAEYNLNTLGALEKQIAILRQEQSKMIQFGKFFIKEGNDLLLKREGRTSGWKPTPGQNFSKEEIISNAQPTVKNSMQSSVDIANETLESINLQKQSLEKLLTIGTTLSESTEKVEDTISETPIKAGYRGLMNTYSNFLSVSEKIQVLDKEIKTAKDEGRLVNKKVLLDVEAESKKLEETLNKKPERVAKKIFMTTTSTDSEGEDSKKK